MATGHEVELKTLYLQILITGVKKLSIFPTFREIDGIDGKVQVLEFSTYIFNSKR